MKIVISRKGFDSQYGGYPNPVLPDGRMISLPIPSDDKIKYSNLKVHKNLTYFGLMKQLNPRIKYNYKWHILTENTKCHLDPDINDSCLKRHISWTPIFGQIGAAQTHLENEDIGESDLFLFFGTFRKTIKQNDMYQFDSSPEFHAIYGYLQIGKVISFDNNTEFPEWMEYHPHTQADSSGFGGNNTIYVARDRLTWQPDMPGAGLLSFNKKLLLTKIGYSKSKWNLPPFFKEVKISYHSEKSWKNGYFQSVSKGQEFVIHSNKKIEKWVKDILKKD